MPQGTPWLVLGLALSSCWLPGCDKEYRPVSAIDYSEKAKRDYDAAMDEFDDKNWESARQKLAEVYHKTKGRPKARAALELVLTRYPTSPFVVPAKHFLERLAIAEKQG